MAMLADSDIAPPVGGGSSTARRPARMAAWRSSSAQARCRSSSVERASGGWASTTPLTWATGVTTVFMGVLETGAAVSGGATRLVLPGGQVQAAGPHQLVRTEQVGHCRKAAPHMHQAA